MGFIALRTLVSIKTAMFKRNIPVVAIDDDGCFSDEIASDNKLRIESRSVRLA